MNSSRLKIRNIFLTILSLGLLAVLIISIITVTKKQGDAQQTAISESTKKELADREKEIQENAGSSILINEIGCSDNIAWVELFNPSNYDVEISGYCVYDDAGKNKSVVAEKTILEAEGFYVLELGEMDLSDSTITLSLNDNENMTICSVPFPLVKNGESYGRRRDGVMSFQFLSQTKGESNNNAEIIAKDYPVFSVPSGFYDEEFELEIVVSDEYSVFFTLDGSSPSISSEQYESPILIKDNSSSSNVLSARTDYSISSSIVPNSKIDKATVIRAVAVDKYGNYGPETNATYFVGFKAKPGYADIPVISVYADQEYLTGYWDGLLVTGSTYDESIISESRSYLVANYWKSIEIPVCLQYFEPDGTLSCEGTAGLKTYKDICLNSIQKSLEITQLNADETKSSSLNKFIEGDGMTSVVLDAGRNDISAKIRNALIQKLMRGREVLTVDNQLCALFLNGEYWGAYNLQQKLGNEFISSVYETDSDDVILFRNGFAENGDPNDQKIIDEMLLFFEETDLSDDLNYSAAKSFIDIESMLDCYAAMIFTANSEWQTGDVYMWRTRTISPDGYSDGRWRFILAETDSSLGLSTASGYTMNTFLRPALHNDLIFSALMQNADFRECLMQRISELANTVFTTENVNEHLGELLEISLVPVNRSGQRFYNTSVSEYVKTTAQSILEFIENRMDYLDVYMQNELVNSSFIIETQE